MDAVKEFIESLPSVDKVGASWFSNATANIIIGVFAFMIGLASIFGLAVSVSSFVASFTMGG